MKNQSGITLSILVITAIIILILTGTIVVSANQYLVTKKFINMENDIKILQESIPVYYEQNKTLPIGDVLTPEQSDRFNSHRNINDNNEYYIIDLTLLPDLNLNYGYGKESSEDYYVLNTGSLVVYYLDGLTVNGKIHYTIKNTESNLNNVNIQSPNNFIINAVTTATTITVSGTTTSEIGLKGYKFRINNEEWTELQKNEKYVFENLEQGTTYFVSMLAVDTEDNLIMADNNNLAVTTASNELTNGMFNPDRGVNTPDTSKLPTETTKYVTWNENNGTHTEALHDVVPNNWYDYDNGQWANIKSTGNNLEAYWVWIPRFAYKLPENSTEKQIEVIFVRDKGTTGANGEKCYYSTDTAITTGGTGLYINATALAKGTETGKSQAWIVHPAFTFGDTQLAGIWVAKYEASSSNHSASYGGGNTTNLKVQVKPNVTSWRYIQTANAFAVCRAMQDTGGAIGTATGTSTIDTHMMKNMEWGSVGILSQSKYGVFNPTSSTGGNGDKTYKVWNNPNISYITGTVGDSADEANIVDASCSRYNIGNGPKASTTGTAYGIYDMAGGAWENVSGVLIGYIEKLGASDAKYYDLYENSNDSEINYNGGKIGDLTVEQRPTNQQVWNADFAQFVYSVEPIFQRGADFTYTTGAGIYAFTKGNGNSETNYSFRPVLTIL